MKALKIQVYQVFNCAIPISLTIDDIKKGTVTDSVLFKVIKIMKNERWHELDALPQGQVTNEFKQCRKIKDSLSLSDEQNIILKDNHIVIPH